MNIILLLIPLSIVLLCLGVWAFFWAVNHAQFDDLETPALMPLTDEHGGIRTAANNSRNQKNNAQHTHP